MLVCVCRRVGVSDIVQRCDCLYGCVRGWEVVVLYRGVRSCLCVRWWEVVVLYRGVIACMGVPECGE